MLTAYDYSTARLINNAGIETILVGDSLGMTMLGYDDTLPITNDEYIELYGNYKAKVDLKFFRKNKNEDGKLILCAYFLMGEMGEFIRISFNDDSVKLLVAVM